MAYRTAGPYLMVLAALTIGGGCASGRYAPRSSPAAPVYDFYYGLLGDAARFDRAADWVTFCEAISARHARITGNSVTAAERSRFRDPDLVDLFKRGIVEGIGDLAPGDVDRIVDALRVENLATHRAEVVQPGGARFVVENVRGRWQIVDMVP